MSEKTRKLVVMAMLVAVSVVLVWLIHFPIFPAAAFLEYDPADIPILIGAFAYGPWVGLLITVVAAVIQGFTVSAGSGLYGIIMHIIATGVLVLVAGSIYKIRHTRSGAIIALICGTVAMGLIMMVANHFITPVFMGAPTEVVDAMLLPVILPFNLIKAGINSLITFLVYKTVSRYVIHGESWKKERNITDIEGSPVNDIPEQYRPLSPWAYFGWGILFSIPIVGLILLIVFSVSSSNINRRNFARSYWCWLVIMIIAIAVLLASGAIAIDDIMKMIPQ